jgi:hypothetical protein
MYSDFHFYIDFKWEDAVDRTPDTYLKEIFRLVELAYQHKSQVFYSNKQLKRFVNTIEDLDTNFSESHGNKLEMILKNAKLKNNEFYAFEIEFRQYDSSIRHIDNVLSFIDEHDKIAVISFSNIIETFLLVKSISNYCIINCKNITTSNNLVAWIIDKKPRIFNLSPKHGESDKGHQRDASPLLCSKEEAQDILNRAIPCFIEREKNLYYFDRKHDRFITFFFEGHNPQQQWHGFHLMEDKWSKVPRYILDFFKQNDNE